MIVDTFNDWPSGNQIEPAQAGKTNSAGQAYEDYGALGPTGYLDLTRLWVDQLTAKAWPATYRVRIELTTTSDWTNLSLIQGGAWMHPDVISASQSTDQSELENGRIILTQSYARGEAGNQIQMVIDMILTGLDPNGKITFQIQRGDFGSTQVKIYNYLNETPILMDSFSWGGITAGNNIKNIEVPTSNYTSAPP